MSRPFPWKCRNCGERQVTSVVVDYRTEMEHDGRPYAVVVPNLEIFRCEACGNRLLSDEALDKVTNALREKAGLLTPTEIRNHRTLLNLTQKQLAELLRVSESTVSRWETGGQIQQRAMDLLLRVFFDLQNVRAYVGANPNRVTSFVGTGAGVVESNSPLPVDKSSPL